MLKLRNIAGITAFAFIATACANLNPHEEVLAGKEWVAVNALDEKARSIGVNDRRVATYYGSVKYFHNGTFKTYTPEGEEKLRGTWRISEDGSVRTIVTKDIKGNVIFTQNVENITIEPTDYVYRIYPSEGNKKQYIDIIHQPKEK